MNTEEILKELNEQQREVVEYNDGPLLVVAGAGTGKTKAIIAKIAYLIAEKKALPSEILAITFTKKAAQEMEERLDIVLPYGYSDVKACNFHSLAEEFLRENAYSLGFSTGFKILTEPQQVLFIRDRIFDFDLKLFRPLSDPTHFIRDLIRHFSHLKDELVSPDEYLNFVTQLKNKADSKIEHEYADEQLELAGAYKTYQELMGMADRMDFGDLIFYMVKALKEKEQLLQGFRKKYKYILVDEFQDTNWAQNELLKTLTLPVETQNLASLRGERIPIITVVGDDDQSIYKFRGAAINNILDFKENWPDVRQVVLTKNYRNTQEVLDASYQLIQFNNPDRLEAKYGIDKKLSALKTVILQENSLGENQEIFQGNLGGNLKPQLLVFENATEEANRVAEEIKNLKFKIKNLKYSDFAILVRSNGVAMPFVNALGARKIPNIFSGNEGLFRKSVIKNIIAFLSILTNPSDNLALFNLLVGEFGGIDFDRLSVVLHKVRSKNIPLEEHLREAKEEDLDKDLGSKNLEGIRKILKILEETRRESIALSAGEILYRFINESDYLKKLASEEKKGNIEAGEKIVSIAGFFDRILGFQEANLDAGVQKFMEYLNILLEIGDDPKDEIDDPTYEAVRILTIHKAKGLEFKYVFMVGLSDSRFPSRNHGEAIKYPEELCRDTKLRVSTEDSGEDVKVDASQVHLQEERRLFYVGMTRAQEGLYFTFGRDYGGKKSTKLSRFVAESLGMESLKTEYFKQTELERIEHFAPKEKALYSTRLKTKEGKMRLSRAEVDDYLTCPRKYKFVHITPIKLMTDHRVVFGRAIHKVIEEYYKSKITNNKLQTLPTGRQVTNKTQISNDKDKSVGHQDGGLLQIDQLLEIYRQNWSSEGFMNAEHEKQRYDEGVTLIKRFYGEYSDKLNIAEVEKPFKFEITNYNPPAGGQITNKIQNPNDKFQTGEQGSDFAIIVEGRIDAIEKLEDGGIRIIDFKTTDIGSQDAANKRAKDNTQLSVYALAIKELTGELPKEVGLFFLIDGVVGTFVPTESILTKTRENIFRAAEGIRAQEFTATPSTIACGYCAFSRYCDDSVV